MARDHNQVFYDSTGCRSWLVRCSIVATLSLLAGLAAVFVVSILSSPALPSVALRLEQHYSPAAPERPAPRHEDDPTLNLSHIRAGPNDQPSTAQRFGFFVNWDDNSFVSLRNNAAALDVLVPEWLHLVSERGDIRLDDQARQKSIEFWLSVNAPKLRVMPLINNYDPASGRWLGEETGRLLRSKKARTRFIRKLKAYLKAGRYAGVVLDLKMIPAEDDGHLVDLVRELRFQLLPENQRVLTVLPAYRDPKKYHELVESVDQAILLAFDQHWRGDVTGPLASQGWFEAHLDKRFAAIAGNKLVVAIGSYAVDWKAPRQGVEVSVRTAWDILRESGAKLDFDPNALNPNFGYRDQASGVSHRMWMLDGATMFNQVAAALAMKPGGLALWRLGTEDPTVWHSFAKGRAPNGTALRDLKRLDPGNSVTYKGQGEVLKFSNQRRIGKREVTYLDAYNLIVGQSISSPPRSLTIERWGSNRDKVIALTFDDGPTRAYTTKILDILKQKNAKATFFVVGAAAALEPGILRRIYNSGHDIGNHTFTHPDLSAIPSVQLDLELNATQRVLESKLGIHSALFRPPFLKDVEPETRRQARTLLASSALGYITIGQRIDPLDWGRPGAEEIVTRTIDYASAQRGNVVLLHDGGGDRSQTVEALPTIIDSLRAKGFRFVTIHELLGLKRNDLMPVLGKPDDYVPFVNDLNFSLVRSFSNAIGVIFVVGIVLGGLRLVLIVIGACGHFRRARKVRHPDRPKPTFAVIVPAYNEEDVIVDCLRSLLKTRAGNFPIIVVDDGSKDGTAALVERTFGLHPRVHLLRKANGGKASALNHGIVNTDVEVVVCVDADTRLAPESLDRLLVHFHDARVGAVAGVVTVGNASGLLARFQALEYITSQNLDRRAFEMINGIGVVPGAIGAWRRSAVIEAGLYDSDTLAEDADLTIKLQRRHWRVINEDRAYAVTEAPERLSDFVKQRFRWMYGTLQVAFKHSGVYRQAGARGLKLFTLPNIVLFQFAFTLISPIMDILMLVALGTDGWKSWHHGSSGLSGRTMEIFGYWATFQVLELAVAALAFKMHRNPTNWWLLPLVFLQRFCYRQLIYVVAIQAIIAAMTGRLRGWNHIRRVGLSESLADAVTSSPLPAKTSRR